MSFSGSVCGVLIFMGFYLNPILEKQTIRTMGNKLTGTELEHVFILPAHLASSWNSLRASNSKSECIHLDEIPFESL